MLIFKRKQIVLVALFIMILVAGYLNWSYKEEMQAIPTMSEDSGIELSKNLGEAQLVNSELENENGENEQAVVVDTGSSNEYFIEARMEKESARSEALEVLREIVDNANSPNETKVEAQKHIIDIARHIDTEAVIENLIKAKGFDDVVVFINQDTVNVVVQSSGLIPSQVAQIMDIVIDQTQISHDKIKIMELK